MYGIFTYIYHKNQPSTPGDSIRDLVKTPFLTPNVEGHLTFPKGHLTIPKGSQRIGR